MEFSSSISYRRFLNDYCYDFMSKHFNDIIDFLEADEDHTFDQYLIENEISHEIEKSLSYVATAIANELGMNYLDSIVDDNDSSKLIKIYDDVVNMIKVKLKNVVWDSLAYYQLAERIN